MSEHNLFQVKWTHVAQRTPNVLCMIRVTDSPYVRLKKTTNRARAAYMKCQVRYTKNDKQHKKQNHRVWPHMSRTMASPTSFIVGGQLNEASEHLISFCIITIRIMPFEELLQASSLSCRSPP